MKKPWLNQFVISLMLMILQYLAFFPLLSAVSLKVFGETFIKYLWLLPLCSWIGFSLCLLLSKKSFVLIRGILIAISLIITISVVATLKQRVVISVVLMLFFLLPSYQRKGLFEQTKGMSNDLLISGIILYLVVGFFAQLAGMERLQQSLVLPSILFLILSLFLSNHYTIHKAVRREGKQPTISKQVIHQNRLMVTLIVLAILFVAAFNWLKRTVFSMIHLIVSGVSRLIRWLMALFEQKEIVEEAMPKGGKPDMGFMEPPGEPALIWIVLEKIMFVVVAIALVWLIYWVLKKVISKIVQWIKLFMEERQLFKLNQSSFDYSEEQESIFRLNKIAISLKEALKKRKEKRFTERWSNAKNNEEKVRFLYRFYLYQQVKKGIKPTQFQTPKEIIEHNCNEIIQVETAVALEKLYEQARYGTGLDKDGKEVLALKHKLM